MLYFLPIEPIEERYSIQWLDWFTTALKDSGQDYSIINPPSLKTNLGQNEGEVLSIYNTNYYKSKQLCDLMELFNEHKITSKDTIFLMDAWNPVLEQLEYVRKISGIKFKICGMLHAGCWDAADFLNRYDFQDSGIHYAEKAWLNILDEIYVASEFHKNLISAFHHDISRTFYDKIKTVNFPLKMEMIDLEEKTNKIENALKNKEEIKIVFPHRLDKEKNPILFDQLRMYIDLINEHLSIEERHNLSLIKSKEVCSNKDEYYNLLKDSAISISFASQETFGIAMLESVINGCIPIVPSHLCYNEMYPSMMQYSFHNLRNSQESELSHIFGMILHFLSNYRLISKSLNNITSKYYYGCEEIISYAMSLNKKV